MGKAEKVTEAGLVEVWASFWPKKNRRENERALIAWLEVERLQAYMEGVDAGLNASQTSKGEWVISKDDILNRDSQFRPGSKVRVVDKTHYLAGKTGIVFQVNRGLEYPIEVKLDDGGGDTFDYDELEELK